MNRSQIINEVKSIIENNPYFRCDICFLRGSFALEKENINSDVDLLVISDDFKGIMYKKRREFISLFFECLSEWMSQPDKQKQAVINTVIKRFEPMQLTKDQIQTIIETYGCISEEEAKCIKRAYVTKRLLESQ